MKTAWAYISTELLKKSLDCCEITLPNESLHDDEISCFKEGRPAEGASKINGIVIVYNLTLIIF